MPRLSPCIQSTTHVLNLGKPTGEEHARSDGRSGATLAMNDHWLLSVQLIEPTGELR